MNSNYIKDTPELLDAKNIRKSSMDFRNTEDIHHIRDHEYEENFGREISYEYLGLKEIL